MNRQKKEEISLELALKSPKRPKNFISSYPHLSAPIRLQPPLLLPAFLKPNLPHSVHFKELVEDSASANLPQLARELFGGRVSRLPT